MGVESKQLAIDSIMARKEEFGWILALPDGDIDLYDHSVGQVLAGHRTTLEELNKHRLEELAFPLGEFRLRSPLIASIEVTRACTLRCAHCYIMAGRKLANELTYDEIVKLLRELRDCRVFCVQFVGGEPLDRPDFPQILGLAHEMGFVTSFATNGLGLTDELIASLPKTDFGMGLSIDGMDSNELIRGRGVSFQLLAEKALKLRDAGVNFNVMFSLNKLNMTDGLPLIQWCRDNGIMFEMVETHPIGRARSSSRLALTADDVELDLAVYTAKEELEDYFEERIDARQRRYYAGFLQLAFWLNSLTGACEGGRSIAYIAADGEVFPCSNCAGEGILSAGSVRDDSFAAIWRDSFHGVRAITYSDFEDCERCELSREPYMCPGRCPALSHASRGNLLSCGASEYTKGITRERTSRYLAMHSDVDHCQVNPARVKCDTRSVRC